MMFSNGKSSVWRVVLIMMAHWSARYQSEAFKASSGRVPCFLPNGANQLRCKRLIDASWYQLTFMITVADSLPASWQQVESFLEADRDCPTRNLNLADVDDLLVKHEEHLGLHLRNTRFLAPQVCIIVTVNIFSRAPRKQTTQIVTRIFSWAGCRGYRLF